MAVVHDIDVTWTLCPWIVGGFGISLKKFHSGTHRCELASEQALKEVKMT